ncbi:alkanesulfonate transporter substrate-binding subunit [Pigmentiphaga humi]|uniref:Alkanesulfonate transporter substrate-binding subunit n=1 Tax=Pigmentiphaga humi TaxID=2478468 RepID=A0A3P4B069_9BURK|nr:ABC transporter substrate-binding protein [Pigmentiphaga humi]VCU69120.1 alkanesulfonate transporter substrate-binding subunit [Pigmentiphaga humi]
MKRVLARLALTLGLATAAAQSASAAPLEIGYLPILPAAQLFITLEQHALPAEAGAPKLVQFQSGPALVQALLAGQLDIAYVGIGPALVARGKGANIKVVASNIVEQVSFVAMGDLAPYFASGDAATAFARFAKDKGRQPVIASYPKGAVPEAALQYWLRNRIKVEPSSFKLIYQGEAQMQQTLLTGAVDGAVILEPTVTTVLSKAPKARVVARGSDLFPKQPGAVLLVREKLINEQPALVRSLVAAHVAATRLLDTDPAKAAPMVQKYVGGGRLPLDLVQKSIVNSKGQFEADPNAIIAATLVLQKFQADTGTLEGPAVDVAKLFDTRFYDEVAGKPATQGKR